MVITFDKRLNPGATNPASYAGRIGGPTSKDVLFAVAGIIDERTVTLPSTLAGFYVGANQIDYAATPADLVGRRGLAVVPFAGFPLTLIA